MPDLSTVPDGTSVFVDTNIFHYHFQGKSLSCTQFITRIAKGEVNAYVNVQVLADLLHMLMRSEALAKGCISSTNPQQLKRYLKDMRGNPYPFTRYQQQFENVLAIGLHVLPIDAKLLLETKAERERYYLMTGDSLHLGTMNRRTRSRGKEPLTHIATNDGDFELISSLTVWRPGDIPKKV